MKNLLLCTILLFAGWLTLSAQAPIDCEAALTKLKTLATQARQSGNWEGFFAYADEAEAALEAQGEGGACVAEVYFEDGVKSLYFPQASDRNRAEKKLYNVIKYFKRDTKISNKLRGGTYHFLGMVFFYRLGNIDSAAWYCGKALNVYQSMDPPPKLDISFSFQAARA
jgi:hypothetical protein